MREHHERHAFARSPARNGTRSRSIGARDGRRAVVGVHGRAAQPGEVLGGRGDPRVAHARESRPACAPRPRARHRRTHGWPSPSPAAERRPRARGSPGSRPRAAAGPLRRLPAGRCPATPWNGWLAVGPAKATVRMSPPSWSTITSARPPAAPWSERVRRRHTARSPPFEPNRITPAVSPRAQAAPDVVRHGRAREARDGHLADLPAQGQAVDLAQRGLLLALERGLRGPAARRGRAVSAIACPGADAYTNNEGNACRRAERRETPPPRPGQLATSRAFRRRCGRHAARAPARAVPPRDPGLRAALDQLVESEGVHGAERAGALQRRRRRRAPRPRRACGR